MQIDKILHLLVGISASAILSPVIGPVQAFAVATVLGVLKEAYDGTGRGDVDVRDFVWTSFGGLLSSIAYVALQEWIGGVA